MSESPLAPYACDRCRLRKASCSRNEAGCKRCRSEAVVCVYSRNGVIRRKRKRKHTTDIDHGSFETPPSHLTADIEVTQEKLHDHEQNGHASLGALSSLDEACAAVWHDDSGLNSAAKEFFLFEGHASEWVELFISFLDRGRPIFTSPSPSVLDDLRASRPNRIRDRAWLVMFYGVVLSRVTSLDPKNESLKSKLRCNLWLALNDVRILLEPSDANIQALMLLAVHPHEFTTPALCWTLVTSACRMLQSIGVNHRRLDEETRKRRRILFWFMHIVDSSLAITFGRPPTFHSSMSEQIPVPTLDLLRSCRPHASDEGSPGLFGAYFMHHLMLLSRIIADSWHCIYGAATNEEAFNKIIKDLDSWRSDKTKVLDAVQMAERPFLNTEGARSVELGIRTMDFGYYQVQVVLYRSRAAKRVLCLESSIKMLYLLEDMVSDSEEPFNGIVWQLMCSPFTPFLILFGEIVADSAIHGEEKARYLAAMECLPDFLRKMALRSTLAKKLERIAVVFMKHARSAVRFQAPSVSGSTSGLSSLEGPSIDSGPSPATFTDSTPFSFLDYGNDAEMPSLIDLTQDGSFDINAVGSWPNDVFADTLFDWVGWDSV